MGGTAWSSKLYDDRVNLRSSKGTSTFAYSGGPTALCAAMDAGVIPNDPVVRASSAAGKTHPSLDPKGIIFRESRDSDVHPMAVPISVLLDVTGSMANNPRVVQAKLPSLMGLLIRKGYVEHPAIQIVALGDATIDHYPLQVGQFESGIEIENDLTNLVLEGGGGGQMTESYELALYFMLKHTVTDHWEKRGEKGYLFLVGDEMPYSKLKTNEVANVIGDTLSEAMAVEQIIEQLREKWEIVFIMPANSNHFNDDKVRGRWEKLLPQRVIFLDDPETISECIAAQIGLFEETLKDLSADLADVGLDPDSAVSLSKALVPAGDRPAKGMVQVVGSSGAASGVVGF